MNNVETWVAPLAATNQYEQYYANLQSGTYIPYNSASARPTYSSITLRLNKMIESRDAIDTLLKNGYIDEETYKYILNNIRMQEIEEDFT